MVRKAILIGGDYKDEPLDGVRKDLNAWRSYLRSSVGGCWRDDEIQVVKCVDKKLVEEAVDSARSADYAIVCFSGHGDIVKDRFGFSCTRAYLNDSLTITEDELNPGSARCALFLDCCRHPVEKEYAVPSLDSLTESFSLRKDTRQIFDDAVARCEKGFIKVYAAAWDESADDDKSFTRTLIGVAEEWARTETGVLTLKDAVPLASAELDWQQNPVYAGGRRLGHFPFAVS